MRKFHTMRVGTKDWYKAQGVVRSWLLVSHNLKVIAADYYAPFDLFTPRGTRIEVKFSPFRMHKGENLRNGKQPRWFFNIHRHNNLEESNVDFYVLVCQPNDLTSAVGMDINIYLVVPAPIGRSTLGISMRTLLMKYGPFVDAVDAIRRFDVTRTEEQRDRAFEQADAPNNRVAGMRKNGGSK
jgi:hypothetical protein